MSVIVLVSNFFLNRKAILVFNCACTVPLLVKFWSTEQFLECVNFMSGASPLYSYKSLSLAHRYPPALIIFLKIDVNQRASVHPGTCVSKMLNKLK